MIRIMGHRGGRDLWPENSLRGFREAIAMGVDIVECDVHVASDGEVMVIHDPTLDRTTHGFGPVDGLTARQLGVTKLRDGDGEGIPTLDAVLEIVAPTTAEIFVEIKTDLLGHPYSTLEAQVLASVERHSMLGRVGIICFVPEILETVRRLQPGITVAAPVYRQPAQMLGGLEPMLDRLDRIDGCLISIERTMLAAARELCMKRLGPDRLCVGVTNDPEELAFWMKQPVRQVATDRPDLALAARRQAKNRLTE